MFRIFCNQRHGAVDDLLVDLVDLAVHAHDLICVKAVARDERIECPLEHLPDEQHLFREVDLLRRFAGTALGETKRVARDIHGEVADPFELAVDFQNRDDVAQIAGNGLVKCENLQTLLLDGDLHAVDRIVAGDDGGCHFAVRLRGGGDGLPDRGLDRGSKRTYHPFESDDLFFQLFSHGFCLLIRTGR